MIRRYIIVSMLLMAISVNSYGQNSEVNFYDNALEREVLTDSVDHFLPASKFIASKGQITESDLKQADLLVSKLVNNYQSLGVNNKPLVKRTKKLYELIHNECFSIYKAEASFEDIGIDKSYNCVTASALYSLVLDELKWDYEIRETEDHVFIVVDPKGESIYLESTNPVTGIIQYKEQFKASYVDYLKENKIIEETSIKEKGIDGVFNEYFFELGKVISGRELAGIQYYNQGIFLVQEEKLKEAYISFNKARVLYPSSRSIDFMLGSVLAELVDGEDIYSQESGYYLGLFASDTANLKTDVLVGRYAHVIYKLLVDKQDYQSYISYKDAFKQNAHASIIERIEMVDIKMKSKYEYLIGNYDSSLILSNRYLKIDSSSLEVREHLIITLNKFLSSCSDHQEAYDSLAIYSQRYDFVRKEAQLTANYCYLGGMLIEKSLFKKDQETALNILNDLESYFGNKKMEFSTQDCLSNVFKKYADYHLDNKRVWPAYNMIKRGLKTLPESLVLLRFKAYMEDNQFLD